MPGMNGAQTAGRSGSAGHIPNPVRDWVSRDTSPWRGSGRVRRADAIVQKPFRVGELERKVTAALATRAGPNLRLVSGRAHGS